MNILRKSCVLIICAVLMFSFTSCKTEPDEPPKYDQYPDTISGVFDEQNIVLTFAALSDTHIGALESDSAKYDYMVRAINQSQEYAANKKLDAVCIAGDLVNATNFPAAVVTGGEWPENKAEASAQQSTLERENFLRCITDTLDSTAKVFYCLGNHDSANGSHAGKFIETFSGPDNKYYDWLYGGDLDTDALKKGNRHMLINGYNFLALEPDCDASGYEWLDKKLTEITTENPAQTVFLFHHYRPANMTFASSGDGDKLTAVLEKYPQVITFGGHTHTPVDFDNSLMQSASGFISVDCGSVSGLFSEYMVSENQDRAINGDKTTYENTSQGLLVEVDKGGNVKISRYSYTLSAKVGSSFVIPAVKADGTRSLDYTAQRKGEISAPVFTGGADKITASAEGRKIVLTFPAAEGSAKIYRYEITVKNTQSGDISKVNYASSLFYEYAAQGDMPKEYTVTVKCDIPINSGTYEIKVTAVDSWGNKSVPLSYSLVIK